MMPNAPISATAMVRFSQPPIIIDTSMAAISAATTLVKNSLPSVAAFIAAPLLLRMTSSPLGPVRTFSSYAFASAGVGRRLMSMPGKKYIPDAGATPTLGSIASGSELMPMLPSGVTMCETALQTKTMIPPTMAAMMILILCSPRFCSWPFRGRFFEPKPGDVVGERRLRAELAQPRVDLPAVIDAVHRHLQHGLAQRGRRGGAADAHGQPGGPRHDHHARQRRV